MGLSQTPTGERIHIGIFGRRNAGKSSVVNAITGQDHAIVSDIKGTTTDPVLKTMELLPLGPIVLIDTPGLDDEGELGQLRMKKAYQMLNKTDFAILVMDGQVGMTLEDQQIIKRIQEKQIPYLLVMNKADLCQKNKEEDSFFWISTKTGYHIEELKEKIGKCAGIQKEEKRLIGEFLKKDDIVVLVVPIDSAAPKGRLILPQQQTIRDILESGAIPMIVRDSELQSALQTLNQLPKVVVTDSQVFETVAKIVPEDTLLTSFSILFARYKGNLTTLVAGAKQLDNLKNGSRILISEGCTHHRQCEDIGTVKLPRWIRDYTGREVSFDFTSGAEFKDDLSQYDLIIHCGGCMLNEREMQYRLKCAEDQGISITNYGTAIAHMKGILERSIKMFLSTEKKTGVSALTNLG